METRSLSTTPVRNVLTTTQLILLVAALLTLPFYTVFNSFLLILFILNTLVLGIINPHKVKRQYFFTALAFASPFLIYLVVFLVRAQFAYWNVLEKKYTIFVLPFVFLIGPINLDLKSIRLVMGAFVAATLLLAIQPIWGRWDLLFDYGIEITWRTELQRPYFALYTLFSVMILIYFAVSFKKTWARIAFIVLALFLIHVSILMYAKMAIAGFFLAVLLTTILHLVFLEKYKLLIILAVLFACIVVGTVSLDDNVRLIAQKILNYESFDDGYNLWFFSSINIRQVVWYCCYELLSTDLAWFFGCGLDSQQFLDLCNNSNWIRFGIDPLKGTWPISDDTYNAHNDFIQVWLDTGILGLFLIITSLVVSFRIAILRRDLLYFAFLIFFIACGMTESLMMRQKGIVLYAIFNSIFALYALKSEYPLFPLLFKPKS